MELASITDRTVVNRKTAIGSGLAALTALVLPGQVRRLPILRADRAQVPVRVSLSAVPGSSRRWRSSPISTPAWAVCRISTFGLMR